MKTNPHDRILLIDDNASIHEDFCKILTPAASGEAAIDQFAASLFQRPEAAVPAMNPLQLDYASQGQEGLERVVEALAEERPYLMAFVDMRMPPGWDGLETIQQIWKVQPGLLLVICTAFSDYSQDEIYQIC